MFSRVQLGANTSKIAKEETRVPQESVIAVILFLVAMQGFLAKHPKAILFMCTPTTNPEALRRKIQAAVSQVAKWAGYEMLAEKCIDAHIFHRCPRRAVSLNKNEIPT